MNQKTLKRILIASGFVGLKVRPSKSFISKELYASLTYNKAGDTVSFNPQEKIQDAMMLLSDMPFSIASSESPKKAIVTVCDHTHIATWRSKKDKWKSISNAILNCVVELAKEQSK